MVWKIVQRSTWGMLFTLLAVAVIIAQEANCAALLDEALFAVEDNCIDTGRNQACYGYDEVSAAFISDVSDDFFTQPSDVSDIIDIQTIAASPLNLDTGAWGVALMNVQADLPNTLPGQNVTFFLLGDTEVENAVSADEAFEPSDGVEVTVTAPAGANVRSGPGLNFNVFTGAAEGNILVADGVSEDGEWLRVVTRGRPAWISRSVIDDSADGIDDLPTLSADLNTPMQAFYLRTGIGQPECENFPDNALIVQGPEDIEVNITANGADVTIGSTVGLRVIEIDGELFLEAIALAGEITFMGQTLQPGERSVACLGEDEDGNPVVTCDASDPETVEGFNEDWCVLDELPLSLLNYRIAISCSPTPTFVPVTPGSGTNDTDTDITSTTSEVTTVNCSTFAIVSPLVPVNSGLQTFTWRTAIGENVVYQLVFYDFQGLEVESFFTEPISTSDPAAEQEASLTINLGAQTATGGEFSWEVRAYQNEVYACVTTRSPTLVRTGELNPPSESFFASLTNCVYDGLGFTESATITWNAAPTTPVVIRYTDQVGTVFINRDSTSGQISVVGDYFITDAFVRAGDDVINLGDC